MAHCGYIITVFFEATHSVWLLPLLFVQRQLEIALLKRYCLRITTLLNFFLFSNRY